MCVTVYVPRSSGMCVRLGVPWIPAALGTIRNDEYASSNIDVMFDGRLRKRVHVFGAREDEEEEEERPHFCVYPLSLELSA